MKWSTIITDEDFNAIDAIVGKSLTEVDQVLADLPLASLGKVINVKAINTITVSGENFRKHELGYAFPYFGEVHLPAKVLVPVPEVPPVPEAPPVLVPEVPPVPEAPPVLVPEVPPVPEAPETSEVPPASVPVTSDFAN